MLDRCLPLGGVAAGSFVFLGFIVRGVGGWPSESSEEARRLRFDHLLGVTQQLASQRHRLAIRLASGLASQLADVGFPRRDEICELPVGLSQEAPLDVPLIERPQRSQPGDRDAQDDREQPSPVALNERSDRERTAADDDHHSGVAKEAPDQVRSSPVVVAMADDVAIDEPTARRIVLPRDDRRAIVEASLSVALAPPRPRARIRDHRSYDSDPGTNPANR
jgi:hypothetical protein